MKKNLLNLATAGLIVGALLFSFSGSPRGGVSLINKAYGLEQPPIYMPYYYNCGDDYQIIVCGSGNGNCTPSGICS